MDSNTKPLNNSLIALRNFSLGFEGRTLIEDASADFRAGTLTALLGRNGAGKSTLLRALAGLNQSYTGEIIVDGDPALIRSPRRARVISFVNTSRVRIANMKVQDVVALGRAPYTNWIGRMQPGDREIVDRALATVGMEGYSLRTLDTLSDGECQRVMIARALAQDTPAILLDEPTSFLDLPNRHSLMRLMHTLAHEQGKCVILSTHELDIALQNADEIALISPPRLAVYPVADAEPYVQHAFNL